ncbi:MAG: WD40 repeat domain-containing protein [Planctomycetota bacterium]
MLRLRGHWEKENYRTIHRGRATQFCPNDNTLLSVGTDMTIRRWALESGKELERRGIGDFGHGWVFSFTDDGEWMAACDSYDGGVEVWHVRSGRSAVVAGDKFTAVALFPGGRRLAASGEKSIEILEAPEGKSIRTIPTGGERIISLAVSPDGRFIAAGGDKGVHLWSARTGDLLTRFIKDAHWVSVAFSPDSTRLAAANWQGELHIWRLGSSEPGLKIKPDSGRRLLFETITFSPDGKTLASGSYDGLLRFWNTTTGEELLPGVSGSGHQAYVTSLSFSPDGSRLAIGTNKNILGIWDSVSGERLARIDAEAGYKKRRGHGCGGWFRVQWSPDGDSVVSGYDGEITVWQIDSAKPRARMFNDINTHSLTISPDGRYLATGGGVRWASVWDLETRQEASRIYVGNKGDGIVSDASYSPGGESLALCTASEVYLYPTASYRAPTALEMSEDREELEDIEFTRDGAIIAAAGGRDKKIYLWSVASGRLLRTTQTSADAVGTLAISPDGEVLVSGAGIRGDGDRALRFWDMNSGELTGKVLAHEGMVTAIAFSRDGRLLASGSVDTTVLIWDWQRLRADLAKARSATR